MKDELISRQAAIDALDCINGAEEVLKALPSVQPEQQSFSCGQENDMISRQDAIEAILAVTGNSSVRELYEHVQEHGLSDMWSGGVNAAIDIIIAVPSAQPEIVRCKDCKYQDKGENESESWNLCGYRPWLYAPVTDNHYCGYAKQKRR